MTQTQPKGAGNAPEMRLPQAPPSGPTIPLDERYRPKNWAEVVGQDKVIGTIIGFRNANSLLGRAFWITGKSGTGKTTIARLIAAEVGDGCYRELEAKRIKAEVLDELEHDLQFRGMSDGGGRAFIVNEAQWLSASAVQRLHVLIDPLPRHAVMVFTTTRDLPTKKTRKKSPPRPLPCDDGPFLSRFHKLTLSQQSLAKPFAAHVRAIAEKEGLAGKSETWFKDLVDKHHSNLREVLKEIEALLHQPEG